MKNVAYLDKRIGKMFVVAEETYQNHPQKDVLSGCIGTDLEGKNGLPKVEYEGTVYGLEITSDSYANNQGWLQGGPDVHHGDVMTHIAPEDVGPVSLDLFPEVVAVYVLLRAL